MIKKILVPLDGSKNSYRGLDEAINLARQCKATVIGIHVKDVPGIYALHPIGFIGLALGKEAKKVIEHAKTICAKKGILFHGKILGGESYSLLDALKLAWSRSSYIVEWILFYPFFGWIIGFFALLIEQVDRVIVHFFGSSWQPLRWMSLPSLVLEQGSLINRWKCSGRFLKKKWGLPVGRFLSIGAVLSACIIPFFILGL